MTKLRMFLFAFFFFFELISLPAFAQTPSPPIASSSSSHTSLAGLWLLLPLFGIPMILVVGRPL